jgi:hypothetical protein
MQLPAQQPNPFRQASPRNPQHESPSQRPLQQSDALLHVQYDPADRQELEPPVFAKPPVPGAAPVPDPPVAGAAPVPDVPPETEPPIPFEPPVDVAPPVA